MAAQFKLENSISLIRLSGKAAKKKQDQVQAERQAAIRNLGSIKDNREP